VWQWVHNAVTLDTGATVTPDLVRGIADEELASIAAEMGDEAFALSRYPLARTVFEQVALADEFADFLTLPAYAAAHEAEAIAAR